LYCIQLLKVMNNKIKIIAVLFGILIIILGILLMKDTNYNIYYDEYYDEDYSELEISDIKLNRYNEKLNNSIISYLVGNLNIIVGENDEISNYGLIQYAMLFAKNYDYRFEENMQIINGNEYINIKYLRNLLKELFNVNVDILKENVNIVDEYIEMNITENLTTDVFNLSLDKILYNHKEDIYLVYINFISGNSGQEVLDEENLQNIDYQIIIRYKKNKNGINTILQYNNIAK